MMRAGLLALMLLLCSPSQTFAEWQLRPFIGATFAGATTFVLTGAAASPNVVIGVNGALRGNIFGVDVDFGHAPGFFQSGNQSLVSGSSATTLTSSVIIGPPRRLTEYTLGPYFVVGAGLMHVHIDDFSDIFPISRTLPAMSVGGGVNGFLSDRIGLSWDLRYFRSLSARQGSGVSIGQEELSFWRASMAVVIRH